MSDHRFDGGAAPDDLHAVANNAERALLGDLRQYLVQRAEEAAALLAYSIGWNLRIGWGTVFARNVIRWVEEMV